VGYDEDNGKDNELEYNYLITCRYLDLVKKSENRKCTSCYNNINFEKIMGKNICY
jgi:hypothetical protein